MRKFLFFIFLICVLCPINVFANNLEIVTANEDYVIIKISSDFEFSALSFELEYNNSCLNFESNKFSDSLDSVMPMVNPSYSDNSVKISIMSTNTVLPGEICTLHFSKKTQKYQEILLKLKNISCADLNGDIINVDSADKWITIGAKTSSSGGGSSATPKEPIPSKPDETFTPPEPQKPEAGNEFSFTDVKETDWYYEAVKFALKNGITSGVSETSYAPNDKVTRGQFITMLCRAYGIGEMVGDNFADCGDTWYTGYLAAAKQIGLSNGVGDNKFAPEKEITREEMVTLIYNYLKSVGEVDAEFGETTFADNGTISAWAKESVAFANSKGYVNGKENNMFDPKGKATRAELAQIFFNMLK